MNDPFAFIHKLTYDDLSEEVVRLALRALTDTLGVGIAGSTTSLSKIIHSHAASQFGAGSRGAALWQDGRLVSAAGATLANGMTIDSLDGHDGYKPVKGHVGCGVVASAIAMMQATGNDDPEELITSIIVGYEIGCRAGIALHNTVEDYHTSGAWITLAAAAIGARLLKLDNDQIQQALGIAEYHGPRSQMMRCIQHPTMVKDGSGWGAMAGVSAAYLAQDGFTGAPAITVTAREVASVWSSLGKQWLIGDQYIKLYPVCRWAQPAIAAVLALKHQHGFSHDQIKKVRIHTFHEAKCLATLHPTTTEQAQYSLPFPVAAALVHDTITAAQVANDALVDPITGNLREKIVMLEDEAFNLAFPQNRLARAEIELNDGSVHISEPTEAPGDPEDPVSDKIIQEKFLSLTDPVLGESHAACLLETVQTLHRAENTNDLFNLLAVKPVS